MPEELSEVSFRTNLLFTAKDEDLISAINTAMQESSSLKDKIDEQGKINKTYWKLGTLKDMRRVHPKKAKVVINRLFTDIETAIPILTAGMPEPTVIGAADNNMQELLQKGLQMAYEVKYKMQNKLQCLLRHWFLFRIGVLKYRWDKDKGFITENVLARKIGFDKRASSLDNCEYFWEEMEDIAEDMKAKFKGEKIGSFIDEISQKNPKAKIKYTEFWGGNGEWVCWKLRDRILDKKKNPNFNYGESAKGTAGMIDYIPAVEGENIFDRPRFPYIILNVFSFGDETGMYDETALIEEAISAQEGVNQLEQQIIDLNEGQKRVWVALGRAVSREVFDDLVSKTGDLGVYVDRNGLPGDVQQVQSGKPDASLYNDLAHLLGEIDNIMGIHSTTRGAETAKQETLGAQQLQMGSDYGRLDLIVRNVEQVIEEWYNAYLQMLKVYSIEAEVLSNGKETVELAKGQIPSGIMIMVKKGSTLPIDERTKRQDAIQLAQFNMIDPATLFEEMSYANVEKRVQDLYAWLQATGKIMPQQPQIGAGGQPGGAEQQQGQQVAKVQELLNSPQFQQLGDEDKMAVLQNAKGIISQVKTGQ